MFLLTSPPSAGLTLLPVDQFSRDKSPRRPAPSTLEACDCHRQRRLRRKRRGRRWRGGRWRAGPELRAAGLVGAGSLG